MDARRRHALVAGLLYLAVGVTGPFVLLYVPGQLYVAGDPTATAQNIVSHVGLFRAHIVVGLLSELAFLGTVLALYRLLRGVSAELAVLMAAMSLVTAPAVFLGIANEVTALRLLVDPGALGALSGAQRDAVATMPILSDQSGAPVWHLFWGLWLLPLGALVHRSGFLPRFVGVWLLLNGVGYVVQSTATIFSPPLADRMGIWFTPLYVGEIALTVSLLVLALRTPRVHAA
jgi:hypothetical protein